MPTPKFWTLVYSLYLWWLVDTVLKEITDHTEDNHTCCTFYRHTSQSSRLLACLTILSRFLPCQWIQSSQTWAKASKESTTTHCNVCTYSFSPSSGFSHSLMTQYLAAYCNSVEKGLPFLFLRESTASCKRCYSGLERLLATPLGWATWGELPCDSAHPLLTSAPPCRTSIGDGE